MLVCDLLVYRQRAVSGNMRRSLLVLMTTALLACGGTLVPAAAQMPQAPPKKGCDCGSLKLLEPRLKQALAAAEKKFGAGSPQTAVALTALAHAYARASEYKKAEPLFARAVAIGQKHTSDSPATLAHTLTRQGSMYAAMNSFAKAETALTRARKLEEPPAKIPSLLAAETAGELGRLYLNQSQYERAEPLLKRSLTTKEKVLGPAHKELRPELQSLARMYMGRRNLPVAEGYLKRDIAIAEKGAIAKSRPSMSLTWDMEYLAWVYGQQGKYALAEPLLRRAVEDREKVLGAESPVLVRTLKQYAAVLRHTGKATQADKLDARARAIAAKHPGKGGCDGCDG